MDSPRYPSVLFILFVILICPGGPTAIVEGFSRAVIANTYSSLHCP